jgi:ribose transport system substrate-binding protein
MSADAAEAEFAAQCPACRVRFNEVSSAHPEAITTSTRDVLAGAPDVGYVISQFDQYLGPTRDGVIAAGRAPTVKGVSTAAQLDGLRRVAAGEFLHADAGQASSFQGWLVADGALRLMRGLPVPATRLPVRLFDRTTVGRVALTPEAEASGEWYGPTDFPAAFARTWGLRAGVPTRRRHDHR